MWPRAKYRDYFSFTGKEFNIDKSVSRLDYTSSFVKKTRFCLCLVLTRNSSTLLTYKGYYHLTFNYPLKSVWHSNNRFNVYTELGFYWK